MLTFNFYSLCHGRYSYAHLNLPRVLAEVRLAALESEEGLAKPAWERWQGAVAMAEEGLAGAARERVFLLIIRQAKGVATYTDKDEYPFRHGARSPFAAEVWERCGQLMAGIETPALRAEAEAVLENR